MGLFIKCALIFLLICLFIFLPFGQKPATPASRYVLRAQVTLFQGSQQHIRDYTQRQKLSSLLNFLRGMDPKGNVHSAENDPNSHHYQIILFYSDGSQNTYHLQDYRYLRKNSGLWQKVSASHAQLLYPLLQLLPPDNSIR